MTAPLSPRVTFKKISAKATVVQLEGVERAYPVYRFGRRTRFERPEVPGQPYRRYRDFP